MGVLKGPENRESRLSQFLLSFHYCHAKDARDKVYALFGLTSVPATSDLLTDFRSMDIEPNYRRTVQDLYQSIAYGILSVDRNLDLLSVPRLQTANVPDLPTWVPDWSLVEPSSHFFDPKQFNTSQQSIASPKIEDGRLQLEGYVIDRLLEVEAVAIPGFLQRIDREKMPGGYIYIDDGGGGLALDWRGFSLRDGIADQARLRAYMIIMARWDKLALTEIRGSTTTKQDRMEAYWRTITRASPNDSPQQVSEMRSLFQSWYHFRDSDRVVIDTTPTALRSATLAMWWLCRYTRLFLTGGSKETLNCSSFQEKHEIRTEGRRLARTEAGRLALIPGLARAGDSVGVFKGGKVPLIIRQRNIEKGGWELIGDCHIHGIMGGEIFNVDKCEILIFT